MEGVAFVPKASPGFVQRLYLLMKVSSPGCTLRPNQRFAACGGGMPLVRIMVKAAGTLLGAPTKPWPMDATMQEAVDAALKTLEKSAVLSGPLAVYSKGVCE